MVLVTATGCQYTPEDFLAYQDKGYGYLAELYPPGTPRDELHGRFVDGEYETDHHFVEGSYDFERHLSITNKELYSLDPANTFTKLMADAALLRTGKKPASADSFLCFESGYMIMDWRLDRHVVLYDDNGRVLTAFGIRLD